jgi:hypothetical protein
MLGQCAPGAVRPPTIVARANASSVSREAEFDDELDRFCDE